VRDGMAWRRNGRNKEVGKIKEKNKAEVVTEKVERKRNVCMEDEGRDSKEKKEWVTRMK
jgi:hypothetical protein